MSSQTTKFCVYTSRRMYDWMLPLCLTVAGVVGGYYSVTFESGLRRQVDLLRLPMSNAGSVRMILSIIVSFALFSVVYLSAMAIGKAKNPTFLHRHQPVLHYWETGFFAFLFGFGLMVLNDVKNGVVPGALEGVPQLSVLISVAMAAVGMALLVRRTVRLGLDSEPLVIMAKAGRDLDCKIQKCYSSQLRMGQKRTDYTAMAADYHQPDFLQEGAAILCPESAYVQNINHERLLILASRYGLVIKVLVNTGDFVRRNGELMAVWPADHLVPRLRRELLKTTTLSISRDCVYDVMAGVYELCTLGTFNRSPAVTLCCLDWLSGSLEELFQRDQQKSYLCDSDDTLRVVWHPVTHAFLLNSAMTLLATSPATNPLVLARTLEICSRLSGYVRSDEERTCIIRHVEMMIQIARSHHAENPLIDNMEASYRKVTANLAAGSEI